jgi:hypothetical protein
VNSRPKSHLTGIPHGTTPQPSVSIYEFAHYQAVSLRSPILYSESPVANHTGHDNKPFRIFIGLVGCPYSVFFDRDGFIFKARPKDFEWVAFAEQHRQFSCRKELLSMVCRPRFAPTLMGLFFGFLCITCSKNSQAFCGFYVEQSGKPLYNQATQVVMMRDQNLTVLAMENNYQGPAAQFAMVIPVPIVLQKENVKTLPSEIFRKIDKLDAPRLVEYWEQDPCMGPPPSASSSPGSFAKRIDVKPADVPILEGVHIKAQFEVGEYEIVVLTASNSSGLETWLQEHHYQVPKGAEPFLRPYVAKGSKFFVAKVNPTKIKFDQGRARLSPLRFHYYSEEFSLPVRLGLINSKEKQELIIQILSVGKRYEVANYPNKFIPTNLNVSNQVRSQFGAFYTSLFDRVVEQTPNAVVTEYAWGAESCDPCPTPGLNADELQLLGTDVIANQFGYVGPFVLSRLHAKYSRESLGEDLVFRTASAIEGGREIVSAPNGKVEQGVTKSSWNNFQARYAIRHRWEGPIACEHPVRGIWVGPPSDRLKSEAKGTTVASDVAFVKRKEIDLSKMVEQPVPELELTRSPSAGTPTETPNPPAKRHFSCSGCAWTSPVGFGSVVWIGVLFLSCLWRLRMRRTDQE